MAVLLQLWGCQLMGLASAIEVLVGSDAVLRREAAPNAAGIVAEEDHRESHNGDGGDEDEQYVLFELQQEEATPPHDDATSSTRHQKASNQHTKATTVPPSSSTAAPTPAPAPAMPSWSLYTEISTCLLALAVAFGYQRKSLKHLEAPSTRANSALGAPAGDEGGGHDAGSGHTASRDGTGDTILPTAVALAGLKLLAVLLLLILVARVVICNALELQCDSRYTLQLFLRQDLHKVALDIFFLFVVG